MFELEKMVKIANPSQPHCATVLVLDTSGSMYGEKINQLCEGLRLFKDDMMSDELAEKRVDLEIITFGEGVNVINDFCSIAEFNPPLLSANGWTPMGEAILKAIDEVEKRKSQYKKKGIDYYRPWIFVITDGEPTNMNPGDAMWNRVTSAIRDGEFNNKFSFFLVGAEPANMELLKMLAAQGRVPLKLKNEPGSFKKLFEWLSKSQQKVSASRVGEQIQMESPIGWAEMKV